MSFKWSVDWKRCAILLSVIWEGIASFTPYTGRLFHSFPPSVSVGDKSKDVFKKSFEADDDATSIMSCESSNVRIEHNTHTYLIDVLGTLCLLSIHDVIKVMKANCLVYFIIRLDVSLSSSVYSRVTRDVNSFEEK